MWWIGICIRASATFAVVNLQVSWELRFCSWNSKPHRDHVYVCSLDFICFCLRIGSMYSSVRFILLREREECVVAHGNWRKEQSDSERKVLYIFGIFLFIRGSRWSLSMDLFWIFWFLIYICPHLSSLSFCVLFCFMYYTSIMSLFLSFFSASSFFWGWGPVTRSRV